MLLAPVADELRKAGHEVWVTARDHAQTLDLTREHWPDADVVGGASPSSRAGKLMILYQRIRDLKRAASRRKPDVAVSLNSYAQVVAARLNRIPAVTLMDYEHQPANHLSFRLAQRVVVPSAFPSQSLRRCGAVRGDRVRVFDGYKEELYLDRDRGGADIWPSIVGHPEDLRCLLRPPPTGAMYHREGNDHFEHIVAALGERPDVSPLILSRFASQRAAYSAMKGVTVAGATLDGLRTLRGADVFIGAGGTMCREAALLGVQAYTVFAGHMAAVDAQLIAEGRLNDLRSAQLDVTDLAKTRPRLDQDTAHLRERAQRLRSFLVYVIEDAERSRA
jgi:uncharacterized protein